ncbi:sulfite exporter TauE/SafE family protein [Streptomyces sp. NA04227]|uniref:urease accessory protein UreH domain-containing protein n=1 Tax=Streptomyces sp. NA04227 TaxID=2742136 RepID=UPI00158FEB82|nr:sulfite exporter TauE/SafE family protein [Streptomyces sp. NA04227]QKW10469.1 sulfite exporter TauE/SafE family protein [Streptomyces sp. NA04227]
MNLSPRRSLSCLAAAFFVCAGAVAAAPAAEAHPLGNFTVNHYTGLTFHPGRVDALVVVDRAEIAAAQERPVVDRDHSGRIDDAEARSYARKSCEKLADQLKVSIAHHPVSWTRTRTSLTFPAGEAGLRTSRLQCALTSKARLPLPSEVAVHTAYDSRRIGWREITARGEDVRVTDSDVPARSLTHELRRYPSDPLADALDQKSAHLRVEAGAGSPAAAVESTLSQAGPVGEALGRVTGFFNSLVGSRELTVPVGLLALLLAVVLGASHALLPGHGKTIMAAYLAGRRGTPRDAVTVGATVTFTHTAGVLALGIVLPLTTHLAGETVLTWLGLASGLIVTVIGLWLLRCALLQRPAPHGHHHHHGPHPHHHGHHHGGHHHHAGHTHHHSHGPDGSHSHPHPQGEPHDSASHLAEPNEPHDHDHAHGSAHGHRPPADALPLGPQSADHMVKGSTSPVLTAPPRSATPHTHTHASDGHVHPESGSRAAGTQRSGLIGMGIAGGLVPSPTALVVLLGAIALGRTAFGVLLVLSYGLGMAATLTLAGLLLVRLRDRVEARLRGTADTRTALLRFLARYGPVGTSLLVLLVGLGITVRAAAGP